MALVESLSGVRGIYGKELTLETVGNYAIAFSKGKKKIVVGCDTRNSSAPIRNAIINSAGITVIDVGVASTPETQFAVRQFRADGGIIITASHNEPEYNGMKFLGRNGGVISPADMHSLVLAAKKHGTPKKGQVIGKNVSLDYASFVKRTVGLNAFEKIRKKNFFVAIDSNGGTGIIAKMVLEAAGVRVKLINGKLGVFNRRIEPSEGSLGELMSIVGKENADFGVGFDCDGDRAEIVLADRHVSGHYVLALLVKSAIRKKGIVVVNDATSKIVRVVAEKIGARVVEVEVGEVNVARKMESLKASVGGEGSSGGGIVWPSRCRDGTLAVMMILKLMAESGKSFMELVEEMPAYYTLQGKENVDNFDVKKLESALKNKYGRKIAKHGGSLKVLFGDSFLWFRESKTESGIVRVIADSRDRKAAIRMLGEGLSLLQSFK
ncbi:hypothetical protein HY638_05695 [Candidatus Woesearchaeota archaeon]|nr:hypothetical protein [Candidatus Woesearchaeota archaeon]